MRLLGGKRSPTTALPRSSLLSVWLGSSSSQSSLLLAQPAHFFLFLASFLPLSLSLSAPNSSHGRYRDDPTAQAVESQGGFVDFGQLNSSAYTGNVNYITLTQQAYWQIPILGARVDGTDVNINTTVSSTSLNPFSNGGSTTSYPQAAIDTGTTLVSVPNDVAQRIYAQVQGSAAVTAAGYAGYYQFPCSSKVVVCIPSLSFFSRRVLSLLQLKCSSTSLPPSQVSLNFGGVYYDISPADFNIGRIASGSSLCLGGIYGVRSPSSLFLPFFP
jgi:hypothetical protein